MHDIYCIIFYHFQVVLVISLAQPGHIIAIDDVSILTGQCYNYNGMLRTLFENACVPACTCVCVCVFVNWNKERPKLHVCV